MLSKSVCARSNKTLKQKHKALQRNRVLCVLQHHRETLHTPSNYFISSFHFRAPTQLERTATDVQANMKTPVRSLAAADQEQILPEHVGPEERAPAASSSRRALFNHLCNCRADITRSRRTNC